MRFLKANKIFDGRHYLPEGSVLVLDEQNLFKDVISEHEVETSNIEQVNDIITPGFINTHCHLELSHLKNKIPQHTGLPVFAKHVITERSNFSKAEVAERMQDATTEMWENGIVAVGDISNTEDSFTTKSGSKIFYHTFIELLGLNPANSQSNFERGYELVQTLNNYNLSGSLAPHSPYSTSNELIKLIADYDEKSGLPFCIHNQESEEETKFFEGKKSDFEDLYCFLNLNIAYFKPPGTSSLQNFVDLLPRCNSILVHNTFTQSKDIESVNSKFVYWCFCPGANKYIENKLPDFSQFTKHKNNLCIGTDSLASNTQLDLMAEANLILNSASEFTPENILQALTHNGAQALGISDKFGKFIQGKNPGLNSVKIENSQLQFIKKIA